MTMVVMGSSMFLDLAKINGDDPLFFFISPFMMARPVDDSMAIVLSITRK
jgi:hypothetical protein